MMMYRKFSYMMSLIAFLGLLFSSTELLAAKSGIRNEVRTQSKYGEVMSKVLNRVARAVRDTDLKPTVKDSLSRTVEGGLGYLAQRNLPYARNQLEEAIKIDPNNALAHLIYGDISVLEGKRLVAGRSYFEFWEKSKQQAQLLTQVLHPEDREVIATHISGRLFLYGMDLPNKDRPGTDLSLHLELDDRPKTLSDVLVRIALPVLIGCGIPFLLYRRFFSDDPSPTADRLLLKIYVVMLLSYFLWLANQLLKIGPFVLQEAKHEALLFLFAGIGVVILFQMARSLWEHERERFDPNTIFCKHCGKSILKLAVVCPFCNQNVRKK